MVCIKKTAFPLDDVGLKEQIPLEICCTEIPLSISPVTTTRKIIIMSIGLKQNFYNKN